MTRTTLRLRNDLKKQAKLLAAREDMTEQELFNKALEGYLRNKAKNTAKKIVFITHDLGANLDNLTRDDFYE